MISIVTGTLDRKTLLPNLIKNTVDSNDKLELILVDGGSTDGTIEYIKNLNHERIKLIEVGERSSYPHFMNLGIKNSKYDWVCQWNDDVLLVDNWDDVIKELDNDNDFYLFDWKYGSESDINNPDWISGIYHENQNNKGWCVCDEYDKSGEIVMNYGIYNKKIFREIGMYRNEFKYYYADGDMTRRAHLFGYKHKTLKNIRVCSLEVEKKAIQSNDYGVYETCHQEYKNKFLNPNIELLK
jgi:glycosyltransferase involved in cell wall biosynthesis